MAGVERGRAPGEREKGRGLGREGKGRAPFPFPRFRGFHPPHFPPLFAPAT